MLELLQERENDCFHTCVACITGLVKHSMPDRYPVWLPPDLEKYWNKWGREKGIRFELVWDEPEGISIAMIQMLDPLRETDYHSVVWENGQMRWNPARVIESEMGDVDAWVRILSHP